MPNITIGGVTAFSYASIEYADDYLVFDPNFTAWNSLSEEDKGRYLVSATRFLDTLNWKSPEYDTQEKREAESRIVQATVILAAMISRGEADFISSGSTSTGVKRQKAGSVEIEYFGSGSTVTIGNGTLPAQLWALLKDFLGGGSGSNLAVGFLSFGTDGKSANSQRYGLYP